MSSQFEFLGPYRIGQLLGRGGMGSVFAAVHETTGEEVAVKLIAEHVADEMRFRKRFDREIKTLLRLQHEGIVAIVGVGEEKGRLFYSMEMVHGESLQTRIRREKRMDWRATINIAIQICSALKHAHDAGVFHRDLKPANLILEADDKVKLVDFGISKLYGYEGEQTADGAILGTADYMAPEQATGKPITARTDLYALGCVLYAMLAGRPPFIGKRVTEVIEALKRDRPVPLDLVNPELPDELVELVHQLLEKDVGDRPPTALVVMNRLKAMRAGLQREQTVVADGLPTEGGLEPSTEDTNVVGDLSSAATGVTQPGKKRPPTVVSKGAEKQVSRVSSDQPTVVSGAGPTETPDGQSSDDEDSDLSSANTHFETVEADRPERRLFHDDDAEGASWIHAVLLVTVLGAVFAGGWWFVNSTRKATPAELLQVIDNPKASAVDQMQALTNFVNYARQEGGPSEDPSHAPDPEKPYADHKRYAQIYDLWMEAKLTRKVKLLTARQKAGTNPPDAFEQGFLNAMKDRKSRPQESHDLIQAWLAVHDGPGESAAPNDQTTVDRQEMILLARHEWETSQSRKPELAMHPNARELIAKMTHSAVNDPVQQARTLIEGVLKLHADEAWAEPVMIEGRRLLKSLETAD